MGNYEWYLAGYDFLVARWNHICLNEDCALGNLPSVLAYVHEMKLTAWDEKVGNPKGWRAAEEGK